MNRIETLFLAVAACLMLFLAGCYVGTETGYGPYAGGGAAYYYYPDYEVYYYPGPGVYYWYADGRWHNDRKLPDRYVNVIRDRDRVRLNWPREPHLDHDRVRRDYPARRDNPDRDRDRNRDRERSPY
jgi:hypothetical protein